LGAVLCHDLCMIKTRSLPDMNTHFTGSHGSLEVRQLEGHVRMSDMGQGPTQIPVYIRTPFGRRDYLLATGHAQEADEVAVRL
jgi:hypothetical protein